MSKPGLFVNGIQFCQFRKFRDEKYEFKNSRNTISGANGSGKTTILLALKKLTIDSQSLEYKPDPINLPNPNVMINLEHEDSILSLCGFGNPELSSFSIRVDNEGAEVAHTENDARQIMQRISSHVIDLDHLHEECKDEAKSSKYGMSQIDIWMNLVKDKLLHNSVIIGEAEWENFVDDSVYEFEEWRDFEWSFENHQSILACHTPRYGENKDHNIIHLWSAEDRNQYDLLNQIIDYLQLQNVSEDLFAESTYWNKGKKVSSKSKLDLKELFSFSEYQMINIEGNDINGVVSNLASQGVFFVLILETDSGWSGSSYFGIISAHPSEKTIVAKIDKNFDIQSFCKAFIEKIDCDVKSFGMWISANDFYGIEPILAANEIKEMSDLNQRHRFDYDSLVLGRKFYKTGDGIEKLERFPNSILLSTRFTFKGVFCFTPTELIAEITRQGIPVLSEMVHLKLDLNIADNRYVKLILNGLLCTKYERLLSYNGKINYKNLVNLFHVYLPKIEEQQLVMNYYDQISDQITEKSLRLQEIAMPNFSPLEIDSYTSLDWIKDIPYPLASILQTYRTISDNEPDKQLSQLLYFFEAFSQFLAMVHLSAWQKSSQWGLVWSNFTNKQEQQGKPIDKSLSKPDFGFWNRINNKFRKENNKQKCDLSIYTGLGEEFLSMVKSREITEILDECAIIRNNTKGHGVIRNQIAIENLNALLKKLNRLRGFIHKPFASVEMIRPGLGQMKSKYHCEVELLTGVSTPFRKKKLQFTSPPSSEHDFLTSLGSETCLKLVPLLKRGPFLEAYEFSYYFYSRKTNDQVMFNNYHSIIEGSKNYPAVEETELLSFLDNLTD
jgi:energy-coupling factor transporter ATP-binding protein EcfA2